MIGLMPFVVSAILLCSSSTSLPARPASTFKPTPASIGQLEGQNLEYARRGTSRATVELYDSANARQNIRKWLKATATAASCAR